MKIIIYILLFFLVISCKEHNNARKEKWMHQYLVGKRELVEKRGLNEELKKGLEFYIEKREISDSLDRNVIYTIEFFDKDKYSPKDSVVYISTLNCGIKGIGYKGGFLFKEYLVIILDEKNIGLHFYRRQKLMNIPFYTLNCVDEKIRLMLDYKIKKDKLLGWYP